MTIAELNACDRTRFVDAIGWTFEHSPWVAERAWRRKPFTSVDDLHAAMMQEVAAARVDEQLALLCAHPDLGTRARMSESSASEQAGAGLDRMTPSAFDRLQRLNASYRQTFGFPFLFAVKGRTAAEILDALETRLHGRYEDEFVEALRQVSRIARGRLEQAVSEG